MASVSQSGIDGGTESDQIHPVIEVNGDVNVNVLSSHLIEQWFTQSNLTEYELTESDRTIRTFVLRSRTESNLTEYELIGSDRTLRTFVLRSRTESKLTSSVRLLFLTLFFLPTTQDAHGIGGGVNRQRWRSVWGAPRGKKILMRELARSMGEGGSGRNTHHYFPPPYIFFVIAQRNVIPLKYFFRE